MNAEPPDLHQLPSHRSWLAVAAMAAVNLAAFWTLLRASYDPTAYRAAPATYGTVDLVWIAVSGLLVVGLLIWLIRQPDECPRLMRAGLVVTAASVVVLAKRALGAPVQCLDPILFATGCGWTMALWVSSTWRVAGDDQEQLCEGLPTPHMNGPKVSSIESNQETVGSGSAARSGDPRRTSVVNRRGNAVPTRMGFLLVAVVVAAIGLFVYYMTQQIRAFNNLGLGYDDCGEHARMLYNTIYNPRELFLRINPDKPLFYDHFQPGILLLVPLWFLWPDLKLTILLQIISALGPALPLYWIGKRLFQDKAAALLLAMAWLVYPSVSQFIYSGGYGFRSGNVCLLLYFVAVALWIHGRRGWALAAALWAISIKEEAAILAAMFGLYLALFERRRWLGAAIAVGGFAYFMVMSSVIIPAMSQRGGYPEQHYFADLGATKWDILLSPIANPGVFWGRLLSPATFYLGALLLAPLLFVPLRRASVLFIGSLVFVFDCLSPMMQNSICYWYQATLFPVLFWALAAALQNADSQRRRATLSGAVMAGVLLTLFFGNSFWSKADWSVSMFPGRLPLVQRMARQIDPSGSLFVSPRAAAHFVTQKYLYTDPTRLPPQLDYVLLDLYDPVLTLGVTRDVQYRVEARSDVHLVGAEDGLLLYARQGAPLDRRAVVERDALPSDAIPREVHFSSGVNIIGFSLTAQASESGEPSDIVHITTFSVVPVPTDTDVAVRCALAVKDGNAATGGFASKLQFLGQSIWPVSRWTTNKVYCDDFRVSLPRGTANQPFAIRFEALPLSAIP